MELHLGFAHRREPLVCTGEGIRLLVACTLHSAIAEGRFNGRFLYFKPSKVFCRICQSLSPLNFAIAVALIPASFAFLVGLLAL